MQTLLLALALILPFELPEFAGPLYRSSEHPNSVFVIEAYFNTCPHCNENADNVNELAAEYPQVQVLDVGIDKKDSDYQKWVQKHNPNHPVLMDGSKQLIKKLGTTGYPSTYVISGDGEVIFQTSGVWSNATKRKIREALESHSFFEG